ncbi:sugar transferase [Virgibacillus indicus]|uniref:Sugar transferase n=1 Tax=Virgibacillus indicus TaxID=2024554 RepID=A0A265NAB1_9BACI|nr:sugar transferase [Virgibacillus indicus]OZU88236.1 sugar transferase [Virgibacillus indicus]
MKRLLDITVSLIAIIILLIPMAVLSVVVLIKMGAPITFKQKRPGLHGKPFYIRKFRTMTNETDEQGNLLPNSDRMTKTGNLLRKFSLDELPQLFNVLKGDISLVGPRPLLMDYLELYTLEQARRHEVKPGITGWAQVNGRNAITWEDKFKYDVWYVDNSSFMLDIKILIMTLAKVIKSDGVNKSENVTMERFRGTGTDE